jgi:RHS repeat-associated protein
MSQAIVNGSTTTYIYNAMGQLIHKSGNGGNTLLMYDEAGHILGEYSSTGVLVQETIWLGDTPVATLRPNGSSVTIYYVHADHLGTPRKVTRPSDNGLMWRWDPDTFGSVAPNQNPSKLGTFVYNLRFPGQYSLNESGLYYNYYRTYDPQMGRYIESDPIGLRGGINPYAYVNGNPVSLTDPLGLCRDRPQCKALRQNIDRKSALLQENLAKYSPELDAVGGFPMKYGSGLTSPGGHYNEIKELQQGLRRDIYNYDRLDCDEDDDQGTGFGAVANDIRDMARQFVEPPPPPTPTASSTSSTSNTSTWGAILTTILVGGAVVIFGPN